VVEQKEGRKGRYVEETADGAEREAGLIEPLDACGHVGRVAAHEVHAEELHIGHSAQ